MGPQIPEETKETFRQHLESYNLWSLTGIDKYMFLKILFGVIDFKNSFCHTSMSCVSSFSFWLYTDCVYMW